MFLSCDDLKLAYGVDMEIGRFYVDRKVPADNVYWKKRHLYIPPVPGYYFMPIFSDLVYRSGIEKTVILSEDFLGLAEKILDSAGRLEQKEISWEEHITECIELAESKVVNTAFLEDLKTYFSGKKENTSVHLGTPYPSLNRADAYLFALCTISFDQEKKIKLLESWYALMTYFLILDDLVDIKEDFKNNEENALIEAGLSKQGAAIITDMINRSYVNMEKINPVMSNRIDHKRQNLDVEAIIKSFLKGQ
jgi:hypothetical protein